MKFDLLQKRLGRLSYFLSVTVSMFVFVGVGILVGLLIDLIIGRNNATEPNPLGLITFIVLWFVYFGYCAVRRFHDTDMSGWWTVLVFVPYVGFVMNIILLAKPGVKGLNKYGDNTSLSVMGLTLT
jgi:uncharacterized membrane protein YhaH (DUF805 family)